MEPFLKNIWYVGAWSHELEDGPVARTICNRNIVMYRGESGQIGALDNRCPHRFVPLSEGKVEGDNIRCPYHGLVFDSAGACVERPHDDGPMQPGLCVKSYPVVDKFNCLWLWLGDPAKADESLIPDFSYHTDPEYRVVFSMLPMKCNHQLVTDNILDLSHVHYLHPQIRPEDGFENYKNWTETQGNTVWSMLKKPSYSPGAFQRSLWGSDSPTADGRSDVRWNAPSYLLAFSALNEVGQSMDEGVRLPNSHIVTPETATTCHYFWTVGRTVRQDDEALDALLLSTVGQVFQEQDGPMLEAQQADMGDVVDFLTLKPVILKADAAGIKARRMFNKMLRAEQRGDDAVVDLGSTLDEDAAIAAE
jgi:phenylpropionate dioxygenase-like ring-hydroxylating dioxygenase large terminal subunit